MSKASGGHDTDEAAPVVIVEQGEQDGKRRVASTIDLPVELAEWADERRRACNCGLGDLIIDAIEIGHEQIQQKIKPRTVGGSLFAQRTMEPAGHQHRQAAATRTLSFRLQARDFETMDVLVEEWGAPNRAALIRAALEVLCAIDPDHSNLIEGASK